MSLKQPDDIVNEAREIIAGSTESKQVNKIFKIAKHNFGWSRKAIFEYALETCPDLKNDLSEGTLKNYNTRRLFAAMNQRQKSLMIQRLEQIEKRNRSRK